MMCPRHATSISGDVAERGRIKMGTSASMLSERRAALFVTANTWGVQKVKGESLMIIAICSPPLYPRPS